MNTYLLDPTPEIGRYLPLIRQHLLGLGKLVVCLRLGLAQSGLMFNGTASFLLRLTTLHCLVISRLLVLLNFGLKLGTDILELLLSSVVMWPLLDFQLRRS